MNMRLYSCSKGHLSGGGDLCLQEATNSLDAANQILESEGGGVRRGPRRQRRSTGTRGLVAIPKLIPSFRTIGMKAVRDTSASEPWYLSCIRRVIHTIPGAFQRHLPEF